METVTAPRRRIVADGTRFYSYIEGDPKGYVQAIEKLGRDWMISLRQVPGTAMEHLLRVQGFPEEQLPAAGFAARVGIRLDGRYAVLSLDEKGRLVRVGYFEDESRVNRLAVHEYGNFEEPIPGVWIPTVHRAALRLPNGRETTEQTRISGLRVNEPLSSALFVPDDFFQGVIFTDNLDEICQ